MRPDHQHTPLRDNDNLNREGFFSGTTFYPGQTLVGPMHALNCDTTRWITTAPDSRNQKKRTSVSGRVAVFLASG